MRFKLLPVLRIPFGDANITFMYEIATKVIKTQEEYTKTRNAFIDTVQ